MEPADLLARVARMRKQPGVPYQVAGSMALTAYGEPRFTNDWEPAVSDTAWMRRFP